MVNTPKGRCPYCGGIVKVIESEMTESVLDSNGFPTKPNGIGYNCVGWCCRCNNSVYVDPVGMGFRTFPNTKSAIDLHNQMKAIFYKEEPDKLLQNNSLIMVEGNPFVK